MTHEEAVDIVIIIPKVDELKAFISAFGLNLEKSEGELNGVQRRTQLFDNITLMQFLICFSKYNPYS